VESILEKAGRYRYTAGVTGGLSVLVTKKTFLNLRLSDLSISRTPTYGLAKMRDAGLNDLIDASVAQALGTLVSDPARCERALPHILRQLQWSRALLRGLEDEELGALLPAAVVAQMGPVPTGLLSPARIERARAAAVAADRLERDVVPSLAAAASSSDDGGRRTVFDAEAGLSEAAAVGEEAGILQSHLQSHHDCRY
jgi:hypothetical protein